MAHRTSVRASPNRPDGRAIRKARTNNVGIEIAELRVDIIADTFHDSEAKASDQNPDGLTKPPMLTTANPFKMKRIPICA